MFKSGFLHIVLLPYVLCVKALSLCFAFILCTSCLVCQSILVLLSVCYGNAESRNTNAGLLDISCVPEGHTIAALSRFHAIPHSDLRLYTFIGIFAPIKYSVSLWIWGKCGVMPVAGTLRYCSRAGNAFP